MENGWDQIIVGQEGKIEESTKRIKTEVSEENEIRSSSDDEESVETKTAPDTATEKQYGGPGDTVYYSQYERSYSMNQKKEKYYKYNPKPLGKKNNRSFVPEEKKTGEYWQKRIKNNVAARKSREDRRRKELEILTKKSQYEKENVQLRLFIEKLQSENQYLVYEINLLREEKSYQKF